MRPTLATLVGGSAILMWGGLAALTATAGAVPPLLLTALTFAIGTVVLLLASALRGVRLLALARQPLRVCSATTSSTSRPCRTRPRSRPA